MHPHRRSIAHNPVKAFPLAIQMRHKGRNACAACKKAHMKCTHERGKQSCDRCLRRRVACSLSPNPPPGDTSTTTPNLLLGAQVEPGHNGQPVLQDMWMDWQLHPHSAGQTVQATYHTGYSQVPGWSSLVGLDPNGNGQDVLNSHGGFPGAYSLAPWVPDTHNPGSFFAGSPEDISLTNFSYPEEVYSAVGALRVQHEFGYPNVVPGDQDGPTSTPDAQDSSDEGSGPL